MNANSKVAEVVSNVLSVLGSNNYVVYEGLAWDGDKHAYYMVSHDVKFLIHPDLEAANVGNLLSQNRDVLFMVVKQYSVNFEVIVDDVIVDLTGYVATSSRISDEWDMAASCIMNGNPVYTAEQMIAYDFYKIIRGQDSTYVGRLNEVTDAAEGAGHTIWIEDVIDWAGNLAGFNLDISSIEECVKNNKVRHCEKYIDNIHNWEAYA